MFGSIIGGAGAVLGDNIGGFLGIDPTWQSNQC